MITLRCVVGSAALGTALLLTGCSSGFKSEQAISAAGVPLHGSIHGGQQPVSGATLQLYAVGTAGYYTAATPLLTTAVTSNASGGFSITGDYSCTGADQVYLVATGGNPGLAPGTNNPALALMAALGSCSNLLSNANTTFISMNEVTTVASAWSLSRFMSSPTNAGTSSTNVTGLHNAFAAVTNVVNLAFGSAPGPTLPSGATLPLAEINTLADILAACVNSDGSAGSQCSALFTAATPQGGSAPTDTITAALNIARNPTANIASLFALAAPSAPFQPTLTSAPANWLIGIHYVGGGLASPSSMAIDNAGNVWLANKTNNSVSEFNPSGTALSPGTGYTGGALSAPSGIAIDLSGNAWVSNAGNNSVTRLAPLGSSSTNFTAPGLNVPSSIAIDGSGTVWITNQGTSTVTALSSAGSPLSSAPYSGGGINQPTGIAINAH